jgi:uncharacterized protein (DUF1499 family)
MRFALWACGIAAIALTLLALAGPSYRIGLSSLETAFGLLRWAAYIGGIGAIAALAAAWRAYRLRAWGALAVAALSILVAATAFGVPLEWVRRARNVPPIHDISTDLENPPLFDAVVPLRADAPNTLDRPDSLLQQQREGYPDIAPITLSAPLDQAFNRALDAAQEEGWDIVTADKSTGRIEATDTTRWFGFKDDVAVRLTPWGSGTRVDVRSVSRVGVSDAGTNARRIRRYLARLQ